MLSREPWPIFTPPDLPLHSGPDEPPGRLCRLLFIVFQVIYFLYDSLEPYPTAHACIQSAVICDTGKALRSHLPCYLRFRFVLRDVLTIRTRRTLRIFRIVAVVEQYTHAISTVGDKRALPNILAFDELAGVGILKHIFATFDFVVTRQAVESSFKNRMKRLDSCYGVTSGGREHSKRTSQDMMNCL